MPSVTVLRVVVGAALGLGGADLALINLVLAPGLVPDAEPPHVATAAPPAPRSSKSALVVPPSAAPHVEPRREQVYFETNSAAVSPAARDALAKLAAGDQPIAIVGHADIRGPEALNRTLSKQRAEAVAAELVARGVERTRITIAYAGAEGAATTGPLWRDRRVDIEIAQSIGGRE